MPFIIVLAILGFGIALYAYVIENKIRKTPTYKPACDISERISCSKPITSPYANLFFISNAVVGMAFYVLVALLAWKGAHKLLFSAALIASIVSCVLAYLLYFKIKSLCLVCTALYIINFLILFLAARNLM